MLPQRVVAMFDVFEMPRLVTGSCCWSQWGPGV